MKCGLIYLGTDKLCPFGGGDVEVEYTNGIIFCLSSLDVDHYDIQNWEENAQLIEEELCEEK